MANELMVVEYESLSGIPVKIDAQTVRNTLTRGNGKVTDQEVAFFLRTCQAKKLDPLENGEVWLIKYDDKTPAQMVVGYFAYIRRADKFPDYRGFKAGITVAQKSKDGTMVVTQKEGACVYKVIGEQLIGGWCRVYRQRANGSTEETYMEVPLDEYSTGKSNWSAKPATMIRKVAVSQAFRAAFPNEYEGLYTADEMMASGAIPVVDENTGEIIDPNPTTTTTSDPVISQEQRQELFKTAREHLGKEGANEAIMSLIEAEGYSSTTNLPTSVYGRIYSNLLKIIRQKEEEAVIDAEYSEKDTDDGEAVME